MANSKLWSRVVGLTLLLLFLLGMAVPRPSEAAGCKSCNWILICVGGATCIFEEFCDTNRPFNLDCEIDQWGECHDERRCFQVDLDSVEPALPEVGTPVQGQVAELGSGPILFCNS